LPGRPLSPVAGQGRHPGPHGHHEKSQSCRQAVRSPGFSLLFAGRDPSADQRPRQAKIGKGSSSTGSRPWLPYAAPCGGSGVGQAFLPAKGRARRPRSQGRSSCGGSGRASPYRPFRSMSSIASGSGGGAASRRNRHGRLARGATALGPRARS
jgi:hypothetical protein